MASIRKEWNSALYGFDTEEDVIEFMMDLVKRANKNDCR